jgi:hypothetical protein
MDPQYFGQAQRITSNRNDTQDLANELVACIDNQTIGKLASILSELLMIS